MFQEQEKAEKVSKRESTLNEAESSTRELRELLDQHTDTGTLLELSDDVKVGGSSFGKPSNCGFYRPLLANCILFQITRSLAFQKADLSLLFNTCETCRTVL